MTNAKQAHDMIQAAQWERFKASNATKHFKWGEFFIHRTLQQATDSQHGVTLKHLQNLQRLAGALEAVRTQLGNRPISITSGWRDAVSNRAVGGATRSQHLLGNAVDIRVAGMKPKQVQDALEATWDGGMGYGSTFTHLDIRGFRARFRY
jgi:uncharacterized protein YcbK (DUF882 family)